MKTKQILAGVVACTALLLAVPVMPAVIGGFDIGITASAAEANVFTGEVKKVINAGYLVVPDAGTPAASIAGQFMVKYSDSSEFNIGDKVTVTYEGDANVEASIATVTATSIVAGSADVVVTEAKTEETVVEKAPKDVVAVDDNNTVPTESTTPKTGEGSILLGVTALGVTALVIRKKL